MSLKLPELFTKKCRSNQNIHIFGNYPYKIMPEASAIEFNINHSTSAGVVFRATANECFRYDEHSVQYPGLKFHYEFWEDDDGTLYASLHTDHPAANIKNDPDINLILKIHSFSLHIIREVRIHFDPKVKWEINVPADADEGNPYSTHILNFVCKHNDPVYNASLMYELVKATRKFKI